MSEIGGKKEGISRRNFLRGSWGPESSNQKNSNKEIAARRAEFARTISNCVHGGQFDRALELIASAKATEEMKLKAETDAPHVAEEGRDEAAFLDELQKSVVNVSEKQKNEAI